MILKYDLRTQELKGSKEKKAQKLVELDLISKVSPGVFEIAPIPKYNKSTYTVIQKGKDSFECNCQGYKTYGTCSHILAVKYYLFLGGKK